MATWKLLPIDRRRRSFGAIEEAARTGNVLPVSSFAGSVARTSTSASSLTRCSTARTPPLLFSVREDESAACRAALSALPASVRPALCAAGRWRVTAGRAQFSAHALTRRVTGTLFQFSPAIQHHPRQIRVRHIRIDFLFFHGLHVVDREKTTVRAFTRRGRSRHVTRCTASTIGNKSP